MPCACAKSYLLICEVLFNIIWLLRLCFWTFLSHRKWWTQKASCRMLCIYPWTFEAIHALRDFCTNTSNCYVLRWGPVTSKLPMGGVLSFAVCWFLPFAVVFSEAQRRLFTGLQSGVVMVWAAQFHAWRVASEPMDNFHSESSLCDLEILTSNSIGSVPWIGNQ